MHYGYLWDVLVYVAEEDREIWLNLITVGDSELELTEALDVYLGNVDAEIKIIECIGKAWLTAETILNLPQNV